MPRPIDRTKQSNRVCKNCRAWSWFKKCYEPRSPKFGQVRGPRHTCMLFEWFDIPLPYVPALFLKDLFDLPDGEREQLLNRMVEHAKQAILQQENNL